MESQNTDLNQSSEQKEQESSIYSSISSRSASNSQAGSKQEDIQNEENIQVPQLIAQYFAQRVQERQVQIAQKKKQLPNLQEIQKNGFAPIRGWNKFKKIAEQTIKRLSPDKIKELQQHKRQRKSQLFQLNKQKIHQKLKPISNNQKYKTLSTEVKEQLTEAQMNQQVFQQKMMPSDMEFIERQADFQQYKDKFKNLGDSSAFNQNEIYAKEQEVDKIMPRFLYNLNRDAVLMQTIKSQIF